jgi:hypothetical protein
MATDAVGRGAVRRRLGTGGGLSGPRTLPGSRSARSPGVAANLSLLVVVATAPNGFVRALASALLRSPRVDDDDNYVVTAAVRTSVVA